jgi:hypothetical protein
LTAAPDTLAGPAARRGSSAWFARIRPAHRLGRVALSFILHATQATPGPGGIGLAGVQAGEPQPARVALQLRRVGPWLALPAVA